MLLQYEEKSIVIKKNRQNMIRHNLELHFIKASNIFLFFKREPVRYERLSYGFWNVTMRMKGFLITIIVFYYCCLTRFWVKLSIVFNFPQEHLWGLKGKVTVFEMWQCAWRGFWIAKVCHHCCLTRFCVKLGQDGPFL